MLLYISGELRSMQVGSITLVPMSYFTFCNPLNKNIHIYIYIHIFEVLARVLVLVLVLRLWQQPWLEQLGDIYVIYVWLFIRGAKNATWITRARQFVFSCAI